MLGSVSHRSQNPSLLWNQLKSVTFMMEMLHLNVQLLSQNTVIILEHPFQSLAQLTQNLE